MNFSKSSGHSSSRSVPLHRRTIFFVEKMIKIFGVEMGFFGKIEFGGGFLGRKMFEFLEFSLRVGKISSGSRRL